MTLSDQSFTNHALVTLLESNDFHHIEHKPSTHLHLRCKAPASYAFQAISPFERLRTHECEYGTGLDAQVLHVSVVPG